MDAYLCTQAGVGEMQTRRLVLVVVVPIVATLGFSLAFSAVFYDEVPHGLNVTEWGEFSGRVSRRLHLSHTMTRMCTLLLAHTAHLYLCMPMLHVTKIMYGYWLGMIPGWVLCCAWETLLFGLFLLVMHREPDARVLAYTRSVRGKGLLFRDIVLLNMSSFPLQVTSVVVQFGDVSVREYMAPSALATLVLSFKNVVCGSVIAAGPTHVQIVAITVLLATSSLMPVLTTMYISSHTLLVLVRPNERDPALGPLLAGAVAADSIHADAGHAHEHGASDAHEEDLPSGGQSTGERVKDGEHKLACG